MAAASSHYSNQTPYINYLVTDPERVAGFIDQNSDICRIVGKVKGYALPEKPSCIDYIKHIAYRIWNAFKAIFCMSDWQEARRLAMSLGIKLGMPRQGAEKNVDKLLNKLLKEKPEQAYRELSIALTFSNIVLRASNAKGQVELDAVGKDKAVLEFLRGQPFNDLVAGQIDRDELSQALFNNYTTITQALQALPLKA